MYWLGVVLIAWRPNSARICEGLKYCHFAARAVPVADYGIPYPGATDAYPGSDNIQDSWFKRGARVIFKSGDRRMLFGSDNTGDCIG
jgi:hypothetical protein